MKNARWVSWVPLLLLVGCTAPMEREQAAGGGTAGGQGGAVTDQGRYYSGWGPDGYYPRAGWVPPERSASTR